MERAKEYRFKIYHKKCRSTACEPVGSIMVSAEDITEAFKQADNILSNDGMGLRLLVRTNYAEEAHYFVMADDVEIVSL